jgi:FixJ family two-component response regulator
MRQDNSHGQHSINSYINLAQGGADLTKAPMISIIDDDPFVRAAIDGLVRSLGYRATIFASAEEYLRSDHVNDTSCVITDVQMPGLSGVELQSLLVARGTCTPMIFITAFPEEKVRRRALEAGAIGFLSKPFDDEQLIEHLQTALWSTTAEARNNNNSPAFG